MSYGQQLSQDCESTLDRVTNWLYLFFVPLASFDLLQYYTRLGWGGVPRQSHSLRTNGGRGGGLRDSRIVSGLMEGGLRDTRIVSGLKRFSLGHFESHVF